MFNLIIYSYGLVLMFMVYSYMTYKLQIPGKAPMVLIRRIKDINIPESELDKKYKPLHEKMIESIAYILVKSIRMNKLSHLELEEKLSLVGEDKTPEQFVAKQLMTGVGIAVFISVWYVMFKTPVILLVALSLGALGLYIPLKDLDRKVQERKNMIILELPDFLDMMIISLRAGRTLYASVKKASEQSGPALKPLLRKLHADIELMENEKDALWKFADLTGIQEVKDFVSALEIGLDAKIKYAEEIYRSQSKIMRSLRIMALKRYTKEIPRKLNYIHALLYFNCIIIPIIGSLLQFRIITNF